MTKPAEGSAVEPHAELFPHGADVGVRGIGPTRDAAFEQAALALTSAVTDPAHIASEEAVEVTCEAPEDTYLLLDWLNALIYEMAVRQLVFGRFAVSIEGNRLHGRAWGEPCTPHAGCRAQRGDPDRARGRRSRRWRLGRAMHRRRMSKR